MNEKYLERLKIAPSQCACQKCSNMCQAPCCASVDDIQALIDSGYADRLMLDDLPSASCDSAIIKPAMKGSEGKQSPWEVRTFEGCTFWNKGKCDLHDLGLKPIEGKIAHHEYKHDIDEFSEILEADWGNDRGKEMIEKWKKMVNYEKP